MKLIAHRGDSPEMMARVIRARLADIERGACPFCGARAIVRALAEAIKATNACVCPGSRLLTEALAFTDGMREVLDLEPGPTDCKNCVRLRRKGEGRFGLDDVPPDWPCSIHALCARHDGGRIH